MKLRWIDSKSKKMQEVFIDLPAILKARSDQAALHRTKSGAHSVDIRLSEEPTILPLPLPPTLPISPRSHWERPM